MRRLISYYLLSGAVLLGIGFSSAPLINKLNTDVAYSDGRTLYFKASSYDEESTNGNYGNEEGDFLLDSDIDIYGNRIIDDLASTMRSRLDSYSSSEYEVKTIGTDTIAVTLRTSRNEETQYEYLTRYLAFSGEVFELDATSTDFSDYPDDDKYASILDYGSARIENYTLGTGVELPVVIIPLNEGEGYQESFRNLLKYCTDNTVEEVKDEEGNVTTEGKSCPMVIWANRKETDKYNDAPSDPNVAAHVLTPVNVQNGMAKYVPSSDEEKEESEQTLSLRLIPSSAAFTESGYNPDKGADAYEAANFYYHMLHASKLEYETAASTKTEYRLTYTYSEKAVATVENLVKLGDWNISPALSATLIATLIAIVFVAAALIYFERVGGVAGLVATFLTAFLSFLLFFAFGAQFNVASLVGLIAAAALGLFGFLYYASRLKVELYRGRTLKKANAEAAKKSTWPIIDAGVASILLGVFIYAFGGDIFSKAGTFLAVAGAVSLLVNLAVTRLLFWILCNDDTMQSAFPKLLHVDEKKIPDMLAEEKQSYFGAFANRNFKGGRKIALIASAVLLLAGIGTSVGFQIATGTPYNDPTLSSTETVLRLEVRSLEANKITGTTASNLYATSELTGTELSGTPRLLSAMKIGNKTLDQMSSDITLSETATRVYTTPDSGEGTSVYWYTYNITFTSTIDPSKEYTISVWNGALDAEDKPVYVEAGTTDINEAITTLITTRYISENSDFNVGFLTIVPEKTQPYLWQVALSLGVGFSVLMLYLMIRFRPGKGFALTLTGFAFGFFGVAFFALTRIPATPVVAVGSALGALVVTLIGLFLLNGNKEFEKESKEKEKNTLEFRTNSLETSLTYDASYILIFATYALYLCVAFLFGPSAYRLVTIDSFMAIALGLVFILTSFPAIAHFFMKLFGKIRLNAPKRKKKKTTGQLMKKKTSEAEESIFIGIND